MNKMLLDQEIIVKALYILGEAYDNKPNDFITKEMLERLLCKDIDGKIVENGKNNKEAFSNLTKLGYRHFGFNLMQDTLQPRWIFITEKKNTTVDEVMSKMDSKTRQIIRKLISYL